MGKTQLSELKSHLKRKGTITSIEAINLYGITRLSHWIYELRRKGWSIISMPTEGKNRYGNKVTFSTYKLISDGEEQNRNSIGI